MGDIRIKKDPDLDYRTHVYDTDGKHLGSIHEMMDGKLRFNTMSAHTLMKIAKQMEEMGKVEFTMNFYQCGCQVPTKNAKEKCPIHNAPIWTDII